MNGLKNPPVMDILPAAANGPAGFPPPQPPFFPITAQPLERGRPFFKFSRRNQEGGVCGRAGRLHDSKSRQTPAVLSE
jgi:hypothetical protein